MKFGLCIGLVKEYPVSLMCKLPQTVSSRFPENARKLEDLKPTWLLKDGIGCLDKVVPFRTFQIFLGQG